MRCSSGLHDRWRRQIKSFRNGTTSSKGVSINVKQQLCLLLLTITAGCLWGQSAQLGGRIQDQSEAAVENAVVTVLNEDTGVQRTTASNSQGQYLVVSLPPSHYKVTVEMRGFQTKTLSGLVLEVGQNAKLDFT